MKKHLISFALGAITFICVGCKKEDYKIEKPLVIVDKTIMCAGVNSYSCYIAVDKNGKAIHFSETDDAYRIGDTIK